MPRICVPTANPPQGGLLSSVGIAVAFWGDVPAVAMRALRGVRELRAAGSALRWIATSGAGTQEALQNTARPRFAVRTTAVCRGCFEGNSGTTPGIARGFRLGSWLLAGVGGGRRWRASVAGVGGGRPGGVAGEAAQKRRRGGPLSLRPLSPSPYNAAVPKGPTFSFLNCRSLSLRQLKHATAANHENSAPRTPSSRAESTRSVRTRHNRMQVAREPG